MDKICEVLRAQVLKAADLSREMSDEEIEALIDREAAVYFRENPIPIRERVDIVRNVFNSLRGFDLLQDLLDDPEVVEIMVNGPDKIFYEKDGSIYLYHRVFSSEEKLQDVIQNICYRYNRTVNQAMPIVDTRLPDGSRVNIVLSPVAIEGSVISIRKFPKEKITMKKLISMRSITQEAADFLKSLVYARYSFFITGGTSSGKTTFLNALSEYIPKDERVITIEDSAELQIQGIPNLIRLETRVATMEGVLPITIRDLIKTALRMRPDRIIVGECRGAEAIDMLSAMNTGHLVRASYQRFYRYSLMTIGSLTNTEKQGVLACL